MYRLLIIIISLTGSFNCLSNNNILWERVPSVQYSISSEYQPQNCVYSADNKYIVAFQSNLFQGNWISVYNAENGEPVNNLYFNPDVYGYQDEIYKIFSRKDSNILCCLYWALDGGTLYLNADFYEIPSLKLIDTLQKFGGPDFLSFDFRYSLYHYSNKFRLFDNLNKVNIYSDSIYVDIDDPEFENLILSAKLSSDNKYVVVVSRYLFNAYIFDINEKKLVWEESIENSIYTACLSDDNSFLVLSELSKLHIYDFQNEEEIKTINLEASSSVGTYSIISHDNKYISVINYKDLSLESNITIYDMSTGEVLTNINFEDVTLTLPGNYPISDYLYNQQFSLDNKSLLVCGLEGNYLFDVKNGELIGLYSTHQRGRNNFPGNLLFINNDEYLLTIGPDKSIIWDSKTGKFVKAINFSMRTDEVNKYTISPDGKSIIYIKESQIIFYDIINDTLLKVIDVGKDINYLSVSQNNKYLGYTYDDHFFGIYDMKEDKIFFEHEKTMFELKGIFLAKNLLKCVLSHQQTEFDDYDFRICDFSSDLLGFPVFGGEINKFNFIEHDSKIFIMLLGNHYSIYDIANESHSLSDKFPFYVSNYDLSKDEKYLVTDGPYIIDLETGNIDSLEVPFASYKHHETQYVALSSNGKMLATISPEGRIIVFDVEEYLTPVEDEPHANTNSNIFCYPNPTTGKIKIRYRIEKPSYTSIFLTQHLASAKCISKQEYKFPGDYIEEFDLSALPQGIYNVILRVGNEVYSEKVVVVR